ncbi:DUF3465 domain-containing protein [Catenovulum sp. 2E275]|uniref:DUF3465 domain-containing protein n=1 Tax=Catenovulum sp. 2E275 TaxID=2980497 RepID=UPI0021CE58F2|nr:DUF3465 domain-containing protein [Catenovulum sp. 2E275]MCU4676818.1 DUF3465 domain-containing protein [Catenovulum sp. 2E275]
MKKRVFALVFNILIVSLSCLQLANANPLNSSQQSQITHGFEQQLLAAFNNKQSDLQIAGWGKVTRLLADDLKGSRHQRFIIRLNTGQTILIAHNIDLAPKIQTLKVGDTVEFYGEYEWNKQGGVIHWTHDDPNNKHPHGWLKHNGQLYQ